MVPLPAGAAGAGLAASKITAGSGASSDGFSIDAGRQFIGDGCGAGNQRIHPEHDDQSLHDDCDDGKDECSGAQRYHSRQWFRLGLAQSCWQLRIGKRRGRRRRFGRDVQEITPDAGLHLSGTTIYNQESVTVQALNGGQETIVAIAIAASNSNSASISGSAGIITDSTTAYIANSTLSGVSGSSGAIEVDAYQTSDIAIGGGSLYLAGGKGGVGIALTYASVADPSSGNAVDAHISATSISNYDTIAVLADNASVIAAGAASGGAGGNGAAGAIIVDQITPTTTAYISSTSTVTISVTGAVGASRRRCRRIVAGYGAGQSGQADQQRSACHRQLLVQQRELDLHRFHRRGTERRNRQRARVPPSSRSPASFRRARTMSARRWCSTPSPPRIRPISPMCC